MYKQYLLMLMSVLLVSSCNQPTVFKEVKINNRYTISIPDYLQPTPDAGKEASLQYQNTEKDVYAIVIDEKKKTMANYDLNYNVDTYFNSIASQSFIESIKNGKVSIPGRETINGNKALIAEITGQINETDVIYKMAIIETPYTFYQILVWCRAQNKTKYEGDMMKIIESFKELPLSKDELPAPPSTLNDSVKIDLKY